MNVVPPEVIAQCRNTIEFARELESSTAFKWFLGRLAEKQLSTVRELTSLQPVEETRRLQGRLDLLSELVTFGDPTCPLLGMAIQSAKQALPKE